MQIGMVEDVLVVAIRYILCQANRLLSKEVATSFKNAVHFSISVTLYLLPIKLWESFAFVISYQVTSCPCDTSATIMTLCLLVFEQGRTIHANKAIYPVSMCKTSNYEPILLLQQTRRSELVGRAGGGCYSKPRFMITFFGVRVARWNSSWYCTLY